jgi:hypothetical protein
VSQSYECRRVGSPPEHAVIQDARSPRDAALRFCVRLGVVVALHPEETEVIVGMPDGSESTFVVTLTAKLKRANPEAR